MSIVFQEEENNIKECRQVLSGNIEYYEGDKMKIKESDLVEVLSKNEILKTLDDGHKCEGLQFMPGMERFSGKRYVVLKKVNTIYDEKYGKMVGVKNVVLLKDVICDGRDTFDKEGCDRCCYFFWKERWLKKII